MTIYICMTYDNTYMTYDNTYMIIYTYIYIWHMGTRQTEDTLRWHYFMLSEIVCIMTWWWWGGGSRWQILLSQVQASLRNAGEKVGARMGRNGPWENWTGHDWYIFFRSDMSWFIILSDTLGFDAHQAFCWLNPRPQSECIEIWRRYPTNRPSLIMPAKTCGWNPTRRECKQIQRLQVWGQEFQGTPFWQEIPCAMWDMFYLFLIFHVGIG